MTRIQTFLFSDHFHVLHSTGLFSTFRDSIFFDILAVARACANILAFDVDRALVKDHSDPFRRDNISFPVLAIIQNAQRIVLEDFHNLGIQPSCRIITLLTRQLPNLNAGTYLKLWRIALVICALHIIEVVEIKCLDRCLGTFERQIRQPRHDIAAQSTFTFSRGRCLRRLPNACLRLGSAQNSAQGRATACVRYRGLPKHFEIRCAGSVSTHG